MICCKLPITCDDSAPSNQNDNASLNPCYVPASIDVTTLPPLVFKLSSLGPPLYITFENLVLPPGTPLVDPRRGTPIAMRRASAISGSTIPFDDYTNDVHIVFGAQVLRSLYAAFELQHFRVGLANKVANTSLAGSQQCAKSVELQCVAAQVYFPPTNTCLQPACDSFYFRQLDRHTYHCYYERSFLIAFFVLVTIFVGLEVRTLPSFPFSIPPMTICVLSLSVSVPVQVMLYEFYLRLSIAAEFKAIRV